MEFIVHLSCMRSFLKSQQTKKNQLVFFLGGGISKGRGGGWCRSLGVIEVRVTDGGGGESVGPVRLEKMSSKCVVEGRNSRVSWVEEDDPFPSKP